MKTIEREELKDKLDSHWDAVIVETLPPKEFCEFHLPGAINVPVDEHFEERIQEVVPDKVHPVVVYCYSKQCPASEDAARKMDNLGYENVFDYEAGKVDWKDAGLPIETEHVETGA